MLAFLDGFVLRFTFNVFVALLRLRVVFFHLRSVLFTLQFVLLKLPFEPYVTGHELLGVLESSKAAMRGACLHCGTAEGSFAAFFRVPALDALALLPPRAFLERLVDCWGFDDALFPRGRTRGAGPTARDFWFIMAQLLSTGRSSGPWRSPTRRR